MCLPGIYYRNNCSKRPSTRRRFHEHNIYLSHSSSMSSIQKDGQRRLRCPTYDVTSHGFNVVFLLSAEISGCCWQHILRVAVTIVTSVITLQCFNVLDSSTQLFFLVPSGMSSTFSFALISTAITLFSRL